VTKAEIQIHGYRKGHQLLASSVVLLKDDQAVIDRLSDVAGPLRPKEQFSPYITAYPLPSGHFYVIARTWQDNSVARAGCVLTMSVLVDAKLWSLSPPIQSLLRLLDPSRLPTEQDAVSVDLDASFDERLPSTPTFSASEMLEALFLEDAKPIVVFDAPTPELIAFRIIAALWPDIRRRFALSTFALSPRKIGGRDLDLVFAPMNAKAKFSDWPGRRVDGRSSQISRHRWTGALVRRVFEEPSPNLLSEREIKLLEGNDADSASALRIALLWEELLEKSQHSPTAVLGLLDIANSGMVNNVFAVKLLEPLLAKATRLAESTLLINDAWDYVGAIARKMRGHDMPEGHVAVRHLAGQLAGRAPDSAINFLGNLDLNGATVDLIPSIAQGLGQTSDSRVEKAMLGAPTDILAILVAQDRDLAQRVAMDDDLIKRIGETLTFIDRKLADSAGSMLLPFLVEDRHVIAAKPIFNRLNSQEIVAELRWLGQANKFKSKRLSVMLIERARKVGGLSVIRDVLISFDASVARDYLLAQSLTASNTDLRWLLDQERLSKSSFGKLLLGMLERASDVEFVGLLADQRVIKQLLARLPEGSVDILVRMVMQGHLPINTYIRVIKATLSSVDDFRRFEIADKVLERCLCNRFDGDESDFLPELLGIIGAKLDGRRTVIIGLGRNNTGDLVRRNLIAYEKAPSAARRRIVEAVDEIALALRERYSIDLDSASSEACANIMIDAEKTSYKSLLTAAGILIPSLLNARHQPISLMVAALFPMLYRELASADDVPDLIKFIPFLDWDRCKAARRELVEAFMSSSWRPGDLALTSYRCGDVNKILGQVAKAYGGGKYLNMIENDLARLSDKERRIIEWEISDIRPDSGY